MLDTSTWVLGIAGFIFVILGIILRVKPELGAKVFGMNQPEQVNTIRRDSLIMIIAGAVMAGGLILGILVQAGAIR